MYAQVIFCKPTNGTCPSIFVQVFWQKKDILTRCTTKEAVN